jgi:UDP:flavonoid glycosyltransferase YjiC (YdhE family)
MPAPSTSPPKTRILFFAEAVTLAHVARPVALAQALDARLFDVHFAHHPRYRELLGDLALSEHEINSISPQQFKLALAGGKPLYDADTLSAYVEEDLGLIAAVRPDIIVGDFRLSLAVSAVLASVPYIALSNAYWSPYCEQRYIVPDLPLTRILGPALAQPVFSMVRRLAFALHCLPMNRVRRRYGLSSLGFDLREVYTHGNYTLYADAPDLYKMRNLPDNHRFIGPVVWSPELPLPDWWQSLPSGPPIVYVTLGSSGQAGLLPMLIATLGRMKVTALVSTAGAPVPPSAPENVHLAAYLPGEEAVRMASLVICNGGSPGTHQALAQGVPVIGLASNLDQYLNMAAIEETGAGYCLRAGACDENVVHAAISRMLEDPAAHEAARRLAARFTQYDSAIEFRRIVQQIGEYPERRRTAVQYRSKPGGVSP